MRIAMLLAVTVTVSASRAQAQAPLFSRSIRAAGPDCTDVSLAARGYCLRLAEAVQIVQPAAVLVLAGGNPVPGTASTLGMRLGALPRLSGALRVTTSAAEIADIRSATRSGSLDYRATSINADASVGLFSGFTVAPTIGGFASLDLLASVGKLLLPSDEGFSRQPVSWGAGARLGLVRESFTAPGASLSAMYRGLGDVAYGDPQLSAEDGYFLLDGVTGWSLRAAVSKRLLGLGITGGFGWDRYAGDATIRLRDPFSMNAVGETGVEELVSRRVTAFGNAAFTLLVLHAVAEVGWQAGGSADPAIAGDRLQQDHFYGSLALRLTL